MLCDLTTPIMYSIQTETPIERVRMNHSILRSWYDEVATCMIESPPNASYWQYLKGCHERSSTKATYSDGFFSLPSSAYNNKVRGCCCTDDMPLGQREFDYVMKGYEDGNEKPVLKLLIALSATNRRLHSI